MIWSISVLWLNFRVSTCGTTITNNCTYIQNPSYPSSYTTAGSCEYEVTPISSDICQLRYILQFLVCTAVKLYCLLFFLGWILISLILLMRLMVLALILLMSLLAPQETTKTSVALLLINIVSRYTLHFHCSISYFQLS